MSSRQVSLIGGNDKSIPVFYSGQNCAGTPDHYVSRHEARKLRESRKARGVNRGKAILILGLRDIQSPYKQSVKSGWKVVGQTGRGKSCNGPGMPRWGAV